MATHSQPRRKHSGTALTVVSGASRVTPTSRGLLDNRPLLGFMRSRFYPAVFAYPVLLVFSYILVSLLWGPSVASANLGTGLTWLLWWPLIPLAMFTAGRFWCTICPFGTTIDLVQKIAGLGRPVPTWLKKYGIWIIDAVFLLITWSDHAFGIVESPRGSGYLLGLLVVGAVITAVVLERRAWCRYLCFLGGLSSNYSRSSGIQLRATAEICATCKDQYCYKGREDIPGCPVFEAPRSMTSMANCNFCAACIKSCERGSIRLLLRKPTSELWFISRPKLAESFLAVVIMGIVLVQNITMLGFWVPLMAMLTYLLFDSQVLAFTVVFLLAIAVPFGLVAAASLLSGETRGESVARNFGRFGYAVIPLDLAGHMAHNLFHLLAEGKAIFFNTAAAFGSDITGSTSLLPMSTIQVLQFTILALGIGGSFFTAYKIAQHADSKQATTVGWMPHVAVLALFGLVNLFLFTLPMSHRV